MTPPNILIVMTDHQRADTALPEHGAITPNLDRFAQEGITFTEAFCPSPHCCPSRATFFTGLYPSRHGVWNNVCNDQALSRGLKPGVRLWSEELAGAGYRLHFSGKWQVSVEESPADRGWIEHFVSAARGTHHGWRWEQYRRLAQAESRNGHEARGAGEILRPGYGTYRLFGSGEVETTGALQHDETAVAEALAALRLSAGGQPWCLFVGLIGPHDPYIVPQQYLDLYDPASVPLPPSYADNMTDRPMVYRRMREMRFGQLGEREVREGIRHFWAYCSYLDELFGRLLAGLDATGQRENTLVLYTSDHGDYCGEHGLFAKGIPCFQGAYHIPALVRWPARIIDPGRRVPAFVSLADFGPTFLEAAGRAVDRTLSGDSLLPFLDGRRPARWRDEMHTQCNGVELYYTQRSVTTADYKYVFNGFDRDELYDWRSDPHEMYNVADDPAYEAVKREMCGRMWRFAHREGDSAINPYITVGLAPYGPAEAFREP
jgi:arylsulfatase A-like enzyme